MGDEIGESLRKIRDLTAKLTLSQDGLTARSIVLDAFPQARCRSEGWCGKCGHQEIWIEDASRPLPIGGCYCHSLSNKHVDDENAAWIEAAERIRSDATGLFGRREMQQ